MQSPTVAIESYWRDVENRDAQLTLHVPFSHDLAAVRSAALAALDVVKGISDAVLVGYKLIWRATIDDPPEPSLGADLTQFLGLFYRSDDETTTEAIWIPAPVGAVFEDEGVYTGIRALATSPPIVAFLAASVQDILSTPEGEAFPQTYVVGGLRL